MARKSFMDFIHRVFEKDPGKMVLITSALGTALSAAAQSMFILTNKKYSKPEKAFMVPQELTEGVISVLTLILTTKCLRGFSEKFIDSGKVLSKDVVEYLKRNNLSEKRGTRGFNIQKAIENKICEIKDSDAFKKAPEKRKDELLKEHNSALTNFGMVKDSSLTYVTVTGSIISTAVFIPLIRNYVASKFQKRRLEYEKTGKVFEEKPAQANPVMRAKPMNYNFRPTYTNPYSNLFNI